MRGFTMSVVLDDLILLSRYMGVSSGRKMSRHHLIPFQSRLHSSLKWLISMIFN